MGRVRIEFINRYWNLDGSSDTEITSGSPEDCYRYKVDNLHTIKFEGEDDCLIKIDTSKIRKFEDWEKESYPSEDVKDKILEIVYLAHTGIELYRLAKHVEETSFDNRWKLRALGEQAIKLLQGVTLTEKHVKHYSSDIKFLIVNLHNTLAKEVRSIENLSSKINSSQRFTFTTNRRRLASDMEAASDYLNHYELTF